MKKPLLCVVGPTASGKTALSLRLAEVYGGEIVSADSMQIYRHMDVGTAKPTLAERRGIPHHMLDVAQPGEAYSVARYAAEAAACVDDILARGRLPIAAGGTGLYINALIEGTAFAGNERNEALREKLEEEYRGQGPAAMFARLRAVDPESAARLHQNDKKRVLRALEVYEQTGMTIGEHNRATKPPRARYDAVMIGICPAERELLYRRIDARVDEMLANGLEAEARTLMEQGLLTGTAAQAIGYKELFPYLNGEGTLAEAAERIRRETRRYAKRQLTWFRHDARVQWIYYEENTPPEEILQTSRKYIENSGII